jgi:hypothetical protein
MCQNCISGWQAGGVLPALFFVVSFVKISFEKVYHSRITG